jgi:hypothetical protein
MAKLLRAGHFAVLVLLALCLTSTCAFAQTNLGTVRGHVQDQQGRAITAASIMLRNADTNFDLTTSTNSSGDYSFQGLPLTGQYQLSVNAPQFKSAEQKTILLRAGGTAVFDFTLTVSGEKTEVNVYGTTETVPTESNQVSTRLSQEKIEDTPVFQRKITSLPLLNSSVRPSQTTGDLFLNETLFVINGTGRRQTTYVLDDTTSDDMWGRQTMFAAVPFSAVQEFTVYTNASAAEWAWNAGTAVNLVSRSGSNNWHGDFVGHGQPGGYEREHSVRRQANRAKPGAGRRHDLRPHRQGQNLFHAVRPVHQPEPACRDHFSDGSGRNLQRHVYTGTVLRTP